MIGNLKGMEILRLIDSGMKVTMVIEVGKKHGPWMNQYSIFFISVSFFIVTAATMGYFIFYSAQRLRIARAQSRNQVSLCVPLLFFFNTPEPLCCGSWRQNTGWTPKLLNLFIPQEGVWSLKCWDVSWNSLKLSKETAKSKLSGESNSSGLANFVSYEFLLPELHCSRNADVLEAVRALNCF